MGLKQKFAIWFSREEALRFQIVYERAIKKDGRTNYSEVIKELMGFKPRQGVLPVTTQEDRAILGGDPILRVTGKKTPA